MYILFLVQVMYTFYNDYMTYSMRINWSDLINPLAITEMRFKVTGNKKKVFSNMYTKATSILNPLLLLKLVHRTKIPSSSILQKLFSKSSVKESYHRVKNL